ncbi:MAG: phosphatidate cytidylyltransferase [Dehalococcoidia bacterium]|nr:phosphatidate cytidylyltransferase [Dehalococcoidia bacterium]
MKVSNLQLRLLTTVVGLPLVLSAIWIGSWPMALVAGAIAFLAATEFVHGWLFPSMEIPAAFRFSQIYGIAALMVAGAHWNSALPLWGLVFAALLAVAGYIPTRRIGPRKPYRVIAWCLVYVGLLFSCVVLVRDVEDGRSWLFIGILSTFATDTGAYAVGRLIGRHKMAPGISPKKTWEGAAGGYVAGAAACFGLNALFDTGVSAAGLTHLALVLPIFAQVGDLVESGMKRRMGVKDASGLLPGHGGFLDRMDSILFVMPLVYLFLRVRVL